MANSLAFVEVPEQLTYVPSGSHIVSLSPVVEVALEQMGRAYTRPEDYFDERDLEEKGIANFKKVEELCRLLDEGIQHELPFAATHNLQPARFNFYYLKIIYDALFLRTYQLEKVLKAERPERIIYFQRSQADLRYEWFSQKESFYAPIIEALASHLGIETTRLTAEESTTVPKQKPFGILPLSWRMRAALSRRINLLRLLFMSIFCPSRRRVLCLDLGYNTPFIVAELIRKGVQIWVWDNDRGPRRFGVPERTMKALPQGIEIGECKVKQICDHIFNGMALRDLWKWREYDLWLVAKPRLERVVKVCLPKAMQYFAWATHVFDRVCPDVVLSSDLTDFRAKTIAHVARQRGVPVIGFHHGELGSHHVPIMLYQDLDSVDGYLCYGEGTAAYIRRHVPEIPALAVVGAPMIERSTREAPSRRAIRRTIGLDVDRPVILYLLTNMDRNWRYLSYRIPSDSTCFRIQRCIASVLAKHPEYQVIIKDHPGSAYAPLRTWIANHEWSHIRMLSEWPYAMLIHVADTVIMDAPATSMIQALQTQNAIYVFNNWYKWEPEALESLQKCAVYSDDLDLFCERLDADLDSGRAFEPRPENDDYLRLFCRPSQGVPSARLAADAVEDIVLKGRLAW